MSGIIIFFLAFYILLISVIGYGILFQNLCFGTIKNMKDQKAIYLGFYGLFSLTLIITGVSLLTAIIVGYASLLFRM